MSFTERSGGLLVGAALATGGIDGGMVTVAVGAEGPSTLDDVTGVVDGASGEL